MKELHLRLFQGACSVSVHLRKKYCNCSRAIRFTRGLNDPGHCCTLYVVRWCSDLPTCNLQIAWEKFRPWYPKKNPGFPILQIVKSGKLPLESDFIGKYSIQFNFLSLWWLWVNLKNTSLRIKISYKRISRSFTEEIFENILIYSKWKIYTF